MIEHKLTYERGQYPTGQWIGRCHCGWSSTVDADSDELAIAMIDGAYTAHSADVK